MVGAGPEALVERFPGCAAYALGLSPEQTTLVKGSMTASYVESVPLIRLGFALGGWTAALLNFGGVELYVSSSYLCLPVVLRPVC